MWSLYFAIFSLEYYKKPQTEYYYFKYVLRDMNFYPKQITRTTFGGVEIPAVHWKLIIAYVIVE